MELATFVDEPADHDIATSVEPPLCRIRAGSSCVRTLPPRP